MEHSLHLAAKHFVQTVAPRWTRKGTISGADNEDQTPGADEDEEDNEDDAIEAGDSLGKAIALVKQVSYVLYVCSVLNTYLTDP
jgi:hypothetical protein